MASYWQERNFNRIPGGVPGITTRMADSNNSPFFRYMTEGKLTHLTSLAPSSETVKMPLFRPKPMVKHFDELTGFT